LKAFIRNNTQIKNQLTPDGSSNRIYRHLRSIVVAGGTIVLINSRYYGL